MTKDEALKLALEELADRFSEGWHEGIKIDASDIMLLSKAAQALAQPEQTNIERHEANVQKFLGAPQPEQEPVAWMDADGKTFPFVWNVSSLDVRQGLKYLDESLTPLYTTPPQRKPLTDEQIMANDVLRYHFALNGGAGPISKQGRKVIDAIEAAHGIKE